MKSIHPEWHLDEGIGLRTADSTVVFSPAFDEIPKVLVSISAFDVRIQDVNTPLHTTNLHVRAINIRKESFEVLFEARANARVNLVAANWLAHTG